MEKELEKIDKILLPWLEKNGVELLPSKDSRMFDTKNGRQVNIWWGQDEGMKELGLPSSIMVDVYTNHGKILRSHDSITSWALLEDLDGIVRQPTWKDE